MKLNQKAIGAVIILLIALIVVSLGVMLYAYLKFSDATTSVQMAEDQRINSYRLSMQLRHSSNDLTTAARGFVATGEEGYERQYKLIIDIRSGQANLPLEYDNVYWDLVSPYGDDVRPRGDTGEAISLREQMAQAGFPDEELTLLDEALNLSEELSKRELVAMNMVKGVFLDEQGAFSRIDIPDRDGALDIMFNEEYVNAKAQLMGNIGQFFNIMQERVDKALREYNNIAANYRNLFFTFVVLSLILIVFLILSGWLLARLQLRERLTAQKRAEDENEHLNNSVIGILQAVYQLSQRDLTARAPVTEDVIGTVSDSVNSFADETARVLSGVTDIAAQVENVSNNVKNQADLVTETAEKERQNVEQMVESLFDATQTMNRVAALAEQSNESAAQATQITNNALDTVNNTVRGMESIRETIAETEKRIKRLGERSQEISGIVNLINTISERTHVLALNASMQAAVAGEAGRGFAVVAEEVQRLAENSRQATSQIATLVNNIQIETNETINTVNRTISQVVEGSTQAQQAGEQMRQTQEITEELVGQVRAIAEASEEQKTMSVALLDAVQKIGESTQKTADQIQAQNKETDTLLNAAQNLVESVGVFKLPAVASVGEE